MSRAGQRRRPARAPDVLELSEYSPYWLAMLSAELSRRLHDIVQRDHGLGLSEWRIMAILGCRDGVTAIEASRMSGLDQVAVHRAVKSLIGRGLARRQAHPTDRRQKLLRLAEAGRAVYAAVLPDARAIEAQFLAALPADHKGAVIEALRAAFLAVVPARPQAAVGVSAGQGRP